MHQTQAQRFLHRTSVVRVQCYPWAYLAVVDGLGFIFLEPMGLFCIIFPLDTAMAEGSTGTILMSFVGGVLAISKKEHSLPCLTGFLPCSIPYQSIVSTFKVIKGLNFCKTYQNL